MNLTVSRSAARATVMSSITARVFLGLAVQTPGLGNGVWLSLLLGGAMSLPWLMCMEQLHSPRRKALWLPLLLLTVTDSVDILTVITRSASFLALERLPVLALLAPACITALWGMWRNGDAIGYAATVGSRLFPFLLLLVALAQFRQYRPQWLLPLLGSGGCTLLEGGIRVAGWIVCASAVLTLPDEETHPGKTVGTLALAMVVAALLLLLRLMMTPTPIRDEIWMNRLDSLLTNGRAPLYLQLPMIVMWYAGMLHLLTCEGFAAAGLLQGLFSSLDGKLCGVIIVLVSGVLSYSGALEGAVDSMLSQWRFIAISLLTAIIALLNPRKEGKKSCTSNG